MTLGSVIKPGERGFLAAALGPGMRAVTVPVSAQNSVAGFVFPGDRVDLVLTQSVSGGGEGEPRSEEHTSPVTNAHLVCRLLLEKKKRRRRNSSEPHGRTCQRGLKGTHHDSLSVHEDH